MTVDSIVRMDKIELPPLSLNMLTKSELCDLIPWLIKTVTGTGLTQFTEELRPLWWPDDIPWTTLAAMLQLPSCEVSSTELRRIVRCCYYHSGNEKLLSSSDDPVDKLPAASTKVCRQLDRCSKKVEDPVLTMGFACQQDIPGNFSGHFTRGQRQMINAYLRKKQLQMKTSVRKLPVWDDSKHPVNAWWVKKLKRKAVPEVHPSERVKQEDFLCVCGLVTNVNAVRLKHEAEENHDSVDLDCQIIAVEGPLSSTTVTSPRTPKTLMSQLSRDSAVTAKKRIRFCAQDEGSGNDSEPSSASSGMKQGSLLNIDFSSPLGQRLRKHMESETAFSVIKNPEEYCKTVPNQNDVGVKLRHRATEYPVTFRKKRAAPQKHCHTYKLTGGERREFLKVLQTGLDKKSRRFQKRMRRCVVQLVRLTRTEIRYWTIKRRTIINREIQIDDDISIVKVDIPESSYPAVCHKLPVVTTDSMLSGGDGRHGPKFGMGHSAASCAFQCLGDPHHLVRDSVTHTSLQNPPRHASPPRPQFLVKKVSKNFNGQETQRLVYVPLGDAAFPDPPKCIPSQPISSSQHLTLPPPQPCGTTKTPVPLYRRLGPKSRRKQLELQGKDLQDIDIDVMVESTSTSSVDFMAQKHSPSEPAHPVAVADSSETPVQLVRAQTDSHMEVPHVTQPVTGSTAVLENSSSTFLPHMFPITEVTLLPGQDASVLTKHQNINSLQTSLASSPVQAARKDCPVLTQQLQSVCVEVVQHVEPVACTAQEPEEVVQILPSEDSTRRVKVSGDCSTQSAQETDGELTLSIGAVYSATDLCDQQLASALGLQWVQQSPAESVSTTQPQTQPPNFLLSPGAPSSTSTGQPAVLQSSQPQVITNHSRLQQSSQSQQASHQPRILQSSQYQRHPSDVPPSFPGARSSVPTVPATRSLLHNFSQQPGSFHFTPIRHAQPPPTRPPAPPPVSQSVRPAGRLTEVRAGTVAVYGKMKPFPVELPPVPPPLIKRTPAVNRSPQGGRKSCAGAAQQRPVGNALDDDVFEVICIDD